MNPFDQALSDHEQGNAPPPMTNGACPLDDDLDDPARLAALLDGGPSVANVTTPAATLSPIDPGFDLVTGADIWAPLPPIEYDVGGIVPRASVVLVAGYSSSLKSWLALAMAFAKASGRPWLEHAPFATEQGAVTYLDREAGLYEIRRRLHAIRRPLPVMPDPMIDVCAFPPGNLFDPVFRRRLGEIAVTRSMVFLDTLSAFSGDVDQNSAQMGDGVGYCAEVASKTKATIVIVTHDKKRGGDGDSIDPRERVRGSSAIFGAADVVLALHRTAPREPVLVEQTKARNGIEAEGFAVSMNDAPGGGVTFEWGAPKGTGKGKLDPEERFTDLCERVLAVVSKSPDIGKKQLRAMVTGRATDIDGAVESLLADGSIANRGEGQQSKFRTTGRRRGDHE